MKYTTQLILSILFPLCLASCGNRPYPQSLIDADSLANVDPESAIALLTKLKDNMATADKATQIYYQLLCLKANDKAYIPHTSDSLILPILHYYIDKDNKQHLPEAYYYAGRVYRDLGDAPQALDYFQKAIETIQSSTDYRLISRIYSQMGILYWYQDIYDEALKMFKKAYLYNVLASDTTGIILNLRDLANAHDACGNIDSALLYNRKAHACAQKLENRQFMDIVSSQTASFYKKLKKYDLAKEAIQLSLSNLQNSRRSAIYTISADIHHKTNNIDSAIYYYKEIVNCGTIYAKQAAHRGLAEIAISKEDPQNALSHLSQYLQCTDSILKITNTETIRKMNSLYNYQLREKENNRLKSKNEQQQMWIISIGVVLVFITASFVLYREHDKRKRLQLLLQLNKLETLKDEQYSHSIQAFEDNKKQIEELEKKLQGFKEKDTSQTLLLQAQKEQIEKANILIGVRQDQRKAEEAAFFKSEIYAFFRDTENEGSSKIIPNHWLMLQIEIDNIYNNFTQRLLDLYEFSEFELRVCLLLKSNLSATRIALLTTHSKSAIVSVRKRMYAKVFQKFGTPDDWDAFIHSL